jgi:hypothetical protein
MFPYSLINTQIQDTDVIPNIVENTKGRSVLETTFPSSEERGTPTPLGLSEIVTSVTGPVTEVGSF